MDEIEITDPVFREAVDAIDEGDEIRLLQLIKKHPRLLSDRLPTPEDGYFREPYLLWFVAENPVRNNKLPKNIASITQLIIEHAKRTGVASLGDQLNYTLALVCSGRVAREHNVQTELIDVLVQHGAKPDEAIGAALNHQEVDAMKHLVRHHATITLPVAIGIAERQKINKLIADSSPEELQLALTTAAFYGDAETLKILLKYNVEVNKWNPKGFHSHSTPLHQAVLSGSVDAARVLVNAGADIRIKDKEHGGTSLGWAIYCQQYAVEKFLREHLAQQIVQKLVDQGIINSANAPKAIQQIATEIVA
jgi:hypothetical protein